MSSHLSTDTVCSTDVIPSVTMGIRPMPYDEWFELDREFPQYHKVCDYRIRTSGERLLLVNDAQQGIVGSGHAAGERAVFRGSRGPLTATM